MFNWNLEDNIVLGMVCKSWNINKLQNSENISTTKTFTSKWFQEIQLHELCCSSEKLLRLTLKYSHRANQHQKFNLKTVIYQKLREPVLLQNFNFWTTTSESEFEVLKHQFKGDSIRFNNARAINRHFLEVRCINTFERNTQRVYN